MAPRSGRRVGTSRMAAALDALRPLGYPRKIIRAKMIHLLKVYGGDVGYPFIEADAYKVLTDALFEEEDSKRQKCLLKTPNTDQTNEEDEIIWNDIVVDKIRSPSPDRRIGEAVADNNIDGYSPTPPGGAPLPPPRRPNFIVLNMSNGTSRRARELRG